MTSRGNEDPEKSLRPGLALAFVSISSISEVSTPHGPSPPTLKQVSSHTWAAADYDVVATPHVRWGNNVVNRLTSMLDPIDMPDLRILEAGCGTGKVMQQLLEGLPNAQVTGVDASEEMLEQAAVRLAPYGTRASLLHHDLTEKLPFESWFQGVLSVATFHWITDHVTLFSNLSSALVPGGSMVAQWGGAGNIASVMATLASLGEGWPGPWLFAGTNETIRRLRNAGFDDIDAWLEEDPVTFDSRDELASFLQTVVLGAHLERLDPSKREPFARKVAMAMPEPVVDYVRLNVVARKSLHAS